MTCASLPSTPRTNCRLALAQLVCTRAADAAELARSSDFARADLYIFCVAATLYWMRYLRWNAASSSSITRIVRPSLQSAFCRKSLRQASCASPMPPTSSSWSRRPAPNACAPRALPSRAGCTSSRRRSPWPISSPAPPDAELRRSLDLLGRHVLLAMPPWRTPRRAWTNWLRSCAAHARLPNTVLALAGETPSPPRTWATLPCRASAVSRRPGPTLSPSRRLQALDDDRTSIRRSLEAAAPAACP